MNRLFACIRLLVVIACALWLGGDLLFGILATTAFHDPTVVDTIHTHGAGVVVGTTLAAWTTQAASVFAAVAAVLALLLAMRAATVARAPVRALAWAAAGVLTAACQWWSVQVVTQAMALLPHLGEPAAHAQFQVLHRQSAVAFGLAGVGALLLLLAAAARLIAPPGAGPEAA